MPPKGKAAKPHDGPEGAPDAAVSEQAQPATDTVTEAATSRAKAAADPRMVESLLTERRGYVQRGMGDRVALVDVQIRHYGGEPPSDVDG